MSPNDPMKARSGLTSGRFLAVLLGIGLSGVAMKAGPPFLTDDPEPVDLYHWEFYVFGQGDQALGYRAITGPAIEMNYGILPDTQFHLIVPIANFSAAGPGWASGYGDTEVGVKYRFLDETELLPQIGVFPMAELATGNSSNGLGNGTTWYRLPSGSRRAGDHGRPMVGVA